MTARSGWEHLPRWALVLLGLLCFFLAMPALGMTLLGIGGAVAGFRGAPGSIVAAIFASILAGLLALALLAVGVRMLRSAFAPREAEPELD